MSYHRIRHTSLGNWVLWCMLDLRPVLQRYLRDLRSVQSDPRNSISKMKKLRFKIKEGPFFRVVEGAVHT